MEDYKAVHPDNLNKDYIRQGYITILEKYINDEKYVPTSVLAKWYDIWITHRRNIYLKEYDKYKYNMDVLTNDLLNKWYITLATEPLSSKIDDESVDPQYKHIYYLTLVEKYRYNNNKLPIATLEEWYKIWKQYCRDLYIGAYNQYKNDEEILTEGMLGDWYDKYVYIIEMLYTGGPQAIGGHPSSTGPYARANYINEVDRFLSNSSKLPTSVLEEWYKVYRKAINDPLTREELLYYYDTYYKENSKILTNDMLEEWYNKYIWPIYYPDEIPYNNEKHPNKNIAEKAREIYIEEVERHKNYNDILPNAVLQVWYNNWAKDLDTVPEAWS